MGTTALEGLSQGLLEAFVELVGGVAVGVLFQDDDVELFEDGECFVFLPIRMRQSNICKCERWTGYPLASVLNQVSRSADAKCPGMYSIAITIDFAGRPY